MHYAEILNLDFIEIISWIFFRFDEWIYMWSPRIRIVDPTPPTLNAKPLTYEEGERCLARWSNNQRFHATVQKVLSNGDYNIY